MRDISEFDETLNNTFLKGNTFAAVYNGLYIKENIQYLVLHIESFGLIFIKDREDDVLCSFVINKYPSIDEEFEVVLIKEDIMNPQFALIVTPANT